MAHLNVHFPSPQAMHMPTLKWRGTGFWAIVGVLTLAALLWLTVEASTQLAPASALPAIALSFAGPSSGAMIPFAIEPEFHLKFLQEKRDAKFEELPAQF